MWKLVLANIPMDLSNFIIFYILKYTACKVGLHCFIHDYSSQGKGLQINSLNEEQTFYF